MIRVSGVFRKMLTQAVPKARNTGTGETRIAASSTPQSEREHRGRAGQLENPEEARR